MIGLIGSTLGVVSGMAGAYALSSGGGPPRPGVGGPGGAQPQITPIFMPSDIVNVWTLSIILSIVAGLFPSWKASGLSPIIALRR